MGIQVASFKLFLAAAGLILVWIPREWEAGRATQIQGRGNGTLFVDRPASRQGGPFPDTFCASPAKGQTRKSQPNQYLKYSSEQISRTLTLKEIETQFFPWVENPTRECLFLQFCELPRLLLPEIRSSRSLSSTRPSTFDIVQFPTKQ